jgi:3-hydroxyacyl-CoA dehydrogenase
LRNALAAQATSEISVERAVAFYRQAGQRPIQLRRELPGFIANRLQAALWREACWLVQQGVASVTDIDTAISSGPGLRWAALGPFANMHLSGGARGIAHVLAHLGPAMEHIWSDLRDVNLTAELCEQLIEGIEEEFSGIDLAQLASRRDTVLIDLLAHRSRPHESLLEPSSAPGNYIR